MENLILIRHGQSQYNTKESSSLDSELTDKGRQQIKRTALFLKENFGNLSDFIGITSPYHRCLQSSRIIFNMTDLSDFMVVTGPREIMTIYPHEVHVPQRSSTFNEFDWSRIIHDMYFNNETNQMYENRLKSFYDKFQHCKNLIVVTHGTPVVTLSLLGQNLTEEIPNTKFYPDNGSIAYIHNGSLEYYNKVINEE